MNDTINTYYKLVEEHNVKTLIDVDDMNKFMGIVNKYNIDINSMTDKKTIIKDIMSDKKV